jgi:hypothetical protein
MSHQSNTRTKRERVEYLNPQRGMDLPLCGDGRLHHRGEVNRTLRSAGDVTGTRPGEECVLTAPL